MVIQSAKAAEELFRRHDISFCDRKVPQSFTACNYSKAALGLGRLELMTNKRINETAVLRQKCIDKMIQYIEEDASAARARRESGELVISHYVFVMSFNLIGNLALSRDLLNSNSEEGTEFFDAMDKTMEWGGKPNLADFFPFLQGLDPQRVKKNMEQYLGRTIDIVERFVKERIEEKKLMKERETRDFLDALLQFKGDAKEEPDSISTHSMLIIILEMFFGGTETTSGTI
ncbi:cytochrome P450, putative [Ricinus communis]|uniref:Cytochrome P450, putative n=1 Tax=Ricinus communis TaxID=3988 RepID=B9SRN2_RICCO|nr:cytochrome P450, putative [Ricinus communis]